MGLKIPTWCNHCNFHPYFYALTWPDFCKIVLSARIKNFKTHNYRKTRIPRWLGLENEEDVAWTRNCCGWPLPPHWTKHKLQFSLDVLWWYVKVTQYTLNFCTVKQNQFRVKLIIASFPRGTDCLRYVFPSELNNLQIFYFKFRYMCLSEKRVGSVLENDFWAPPPPINFLHDHFFSRKLVYIFRVRLG